MAPAAADLRSLDELLASTLNLLSQFQASLVSVPDQATISQATPIPNPPEPLPLARDASTLLKAHVTKLSLLAINKPFTPSAIAKIIRDMTTSPLPALMSTVQICQQEDQTWGNFLTSEVRAGVRRVMIEISVLLKEVQSIASSGKTGQAGSRDSLSSTGVVWQACDALIAFSALGVAGMAIRKAEQYRDTLKDAVEELIEWAEGGDLDFEGQGDSLLDSDDEGVDGDQQSLDGIFNAANSLPADREDLKEMVEEATSKGKKVVILYTALVKRRLKAIKIVPVGDEGKDKKTGEITPAKYLDSIMRGLKTLPNMFDELASQFYELDADGSKSQLEKCLASARETAKLAERTPEGKEDEFSTWCTKWQEAVK